ncbi:MAG: hypothetical protein ACK5LJ_17235 [Paracoccus sp. (in: a-proteobacteria)]
MDRIRLSEFTKWIGEERETVRSLMHRGDAPISKSREGETQRTYDGADLLAWCIFTMLRRMGLAPRVAGQAIFNTNVVDAFFKAMSIGEDVSDWNIIIWERRLDRGERGHIDVLDQTFGDSSDVADILRGEAEGYGTANYSGYIKMGISSLITAPLMPCYHRCKATAEAYGFEMRGADLYELDQPEGA